MSSADLSIENINEKELLELIEKGKVDLAILKSRNLATIDNLDFLFLLDRITTVELATYRSLNRTTVYRQVRKDHGIAIIQIKEMYENCKTIALSPKDVFDNIYDYEEFLKWRAEQKNGKKTIPLKDAMEITGLKRKQLLKLIKEEKLVAIRKRKSFGILESSLGLFLIEYLICERKRMDKAVQYLNSKGNRASLKLHLGEICI